MSRHRAIRNRAYSYDEDYDDYYEEEEEEDDYYYEQPAQGSTPSAPVPAATSATPSVDTGYSLSSYFDMATATKGGNGGGGGKKKTPKKGEAKPAEAFDDDLITPAVAMIRGQPECSSCTDEEIIQAVRQANYDADVALQVLLTKHKGSALAQALCEGEDVGGMASRAMMMPLPSPPSGFAGVMRLGGKAGDDGGDALVTPFRFDTPSPDDVVKAARERGANRGGAGMAEEIAGRVAAVKLSAPPPPPAVSKSSPKVAKSSGGGGKSPANARGSIDGMEREGEGGGGGGPTPSKAAMQGSVQKDPEVWEEDVIVTVAEPTTTSSASEVEKPTLSMVVIGHVDAGKSTLMGQVLVGVGLVSERELRKYEKEAREMGKASFFLAWLMDEDKEERAHGVTMDVAHKSIETANRTVVLLDAPGHQDFIPQMITGASQADVALLVVPATTGEFEAGFEMNGQTKEHAFLARGLGVTQLLVAVNKLDAAEPPWDRERFDAIRGQLQPFLELAGFKADKVRYVPVSGLTGENVVQRKAGGPLEEWYSGPTLLEAVDQFAPGIKQQAENRAKPLRAFVTDVSSTGKSIVASVRMAQGVLRSGSKALVLPIGDVAQIKAIEVEGRSREAAIAGEHAELTLVGLDAARLTVGSVLCKGRQAIPVTRRFNAQITTLMGLRMPILKGTQVQLHMQSLEVPVVLTRLIATLKRGGEVKDDKPRCILGNVLASVEVTCKRPVCVEPYSDSKTLGRFILRQKGTTVAIGMITEVLDTSG